MTETFEWPKVREDAIKRFRGALPASQLEQEIIEAFRVRPISVVNEIERIAANLDRGDPIRSPWAILRKNTASALDTGAPVTAEDTSERDRAVRKAEVWIRNTGLYFDREAEFLDELFGDLGMLRRYRDDLLRERLLRQYRELRPRVERTEQAA